MEKENWSIFIEGMGPTHTGSWEDASTSMVDFMRDLRKNHVLFQARFTGKRGEENLMEPSVYAQYDDMHDEAFRNEVKKSDLHEELVKKAEEANLAASIETSPEDVPQEPVTRKKGERGAHRK
jgi:hypothetical protein